MAFSFGGTNQSTFGATPNKPTAFGTPFGSTQTAATTASSGFGSFGSFGANTQPTSSAFGTSGTTFGTTGLFGSTATTKPSLFGTPATTTSSLFSTPATSAPLFGTSGQTPSLFGGTATSQPGGLFGSGTSQPGLFGTPTTSSSLFGGSFGTGTTSGGGLFGTSTSGTAFGGGGGGLFGSTTTSAPSLFCGGYGTTQPSGFFGTKPTTVVVPQNSYLLQQQHNQQVIASIYSINIFNDERDDILKKWNLLQACWGTGKGYYNPGLPPVEYTIHNPFYRFKAVGFTAIPQHDNSEGIVKILFNRKYSELSSQKDTIINGIAAILGNKPNLKVVIREIKTLSDSQAEVHIYVMEKGVTGTNRTIPALDLNRFLNQPTQKQQLTNVGVTDIVALVTPSKIELDNYLKIVPPGFDPQIWKAGIADNPCPSKYIPVPIYGFSDLKARKVKQEHETGLHKAFEIKIGQELAELKTKHAASIARINELKQRFLHLQHRTLKILVKQESVRKNGIAIQPEEEYLKGRLETMYSHLNVPTQFKGQLNELISSVKLMRTSMPSQPKYKLIPETQNSLKDFLQLQQNGIAKLVDVVKDDLKCLNVITEGMKQINQTK